MNPGRGAILACVAAIGVGAPALRAGDGEWSDPRGDAMTRLTDPGADGVITPGATLPDLMSARLSGWFPASPEDPYTGSVDNSNSPDVLRIELVFAGLVNPPGPLDLDGPGGLPYAPFRFGFSPVYGYLELDLDDDPDTGGVFHPFALTRYLANVGRFGRTPVGFPEGRAIIRQGDRDSDFETAPYFERSGAEFELAMCGCWDVTLVSECGNGNGILDAGERMIVNGRFFQLSLAVEEYACFGGTQFGDGPSSKGRYDPPIDLRFTHDKTEDVTRVEMIYPISMQGAAILTGEMQQFPNSIFGGGNHFALQEALNEFVLVAVIADIVNDEELDTLLHGWQGQNPVDYFDPRAWRATALFGTAYAVQEPVAHFVWSDTGFGEAFGDFNANGVSDEYDVKCLEDEIEALDGTSLDADGVINDIVVIPSFGLDFSVFDMNYSGAVDEDDEALVPPCCADMAEPLGVLDFSDVLAFLTGFATMSELVDCAEPFGVLDFSDIFQFLVDFGAGCD